MPHTSRDERIARQAALRRPALVNPPYEYQKMINWKGEGGPGGTHCMVGKLYVGSVHRLFPENWKDIASTATPEQLRWYKKNDARPWRAWIMTDDEGDALGMYATEREAMDALESEVCRSLNSDGE